MFSPFTSCSNALFSQRILVRFTVTRSPEHIQQFKNAAAESKSRLHRSPMVHQYHLT